MRVAIFSEVYWPMISGVAVTLRRLHDALVARGHQVRVYSGTYALAPGQPDRPEVHRSPSRAFIFAPEVQWSFPRHEAIVQDLAAFRPDIVHLATEFPMGVAGFRAARELGVPIIASAHTDYEQYATRYGLSVAVRPGWHYLRWFYRKAHRVLCPTRVYERHLHRRGVTHTSIWTRGVDTEEFNPRFRSEAWRARFGAGPDDVIVSYIGRLAPEKNLGLLLDAWDRLGERRGRAQLVLVGQGLMEETIRRRELPGVHLLGMQHGADLSTAYASSDVFAFPSTTETFGNVLLEAMSSGVASVVAAAGGVLEFATEANSVMVEPDSVDALADGVLHLMGNAELRHRLAAGARQTGIGRRWDAIYAQLLRDYAETISAGGELIAA